MSQKNYNQSYVARWVPQAITLESPAYILIFVSIYLTIMFTGVDGDYQVITFTKNKGFRQVCMGQFNSRKIQHQV